MSQTPLIQEASIMDYKNVLVRRRWTVLTFFIICNVVVILATFLSTPLYRSEAKIIIEGESQNILRAEDSPAGNNLDLFENYLETQLAVIKSDGVAGKVFKEFHLDETRRYRPRKGLAKLLQHKFRDDITLKRVPNTRMVMVGVDSWDPKLARDIANRLSEVYIQDNLRRRAIEFIRNQRMASLNSDFLRLQARLDGMSQQLGPKHPEMIELREEIQAMAKRIDSQRYASTDATSVNERSGDQALLEDTLLKIQESSVISSSRMNNIAVVDAATLPEKVARPKRLLNVLMGLFGGVFGGIVCAFAVETLDTSIKTEDDVKRHIGNIPFFGSLLSEEIKTGTDAAAAAPPPTDQKMHLNPESAWAEAYRLVRTRLLWSISHDSGIRDVAVVSSGPGEGKTTVVCNLGIALAQLQYKVLLVDTDLRRGRLHHSFNRPNEKGLGQYLTGSKSLKDIAQTTDIPHLSIVTCGSSPIDSSHLFSSEKMDHFIAEARNHYNIIIYDTPPINVISDAIILIPRIQATLMVTRSTVTNSVMLSRAVSVIHESKARLLGVVLNAAETGPMMTYHQYYKSYQKQSS